MLVFIITVFEKVEADELVEAEEEKSSLLIASLSSSFSTGARIWYDDFFVPVTKSLTRVEKDKEDRHLCGVFFLYHLLTLMVLRSMPAFSRAIVSCSGSLFSSPNTRSMLCWENARAS